MLSIEASNVSKTYFSYKKPADRFIELFTRKKRARRHEVLKRVSFAVEAGESFGIVGDNGAGKTTLLSILAGLTPPSSGKVSLSSQPSAVLGLGANFIGDLTGRENAQFYYSLLSRSPKEFKNAVDEIVEFSELGDYFDMPIKTYSSGMVARLAFSTAVSLKPQILLIDEVLSVGDQKFQRKSLSKIMEIAKSGCTLVFCSHNLYQVSLLCKEALWLHNGEPVKIGKASEVLRDYEAFSKESRKKVQAQPSRLYSITNVKGSYRDGHHICSAEVVCSEDTEACLAFGLFRNDELFIFGDIQKSTFFEKGQVITPTVEFDLELGRGRYYYAFGLMDRDAVELLALSPSEKFDAEGHELGVSLVNVPCSWKL